MSVKQRLKDFLKWKGISERQFASEINVSSGYVSSISKSIQPEKMQSISEHYPELNLIWLLMGIGEMLQETPTNNSGEENIYKKMYQEASHEIAILNQEIGKLREQLAQSLLEQTRMKNASDVYTSDVKSVG